jgi:hypothetical protein
MTVQAEDPQHHENDDEDVDVGACSRDAGKSEQGRDEPVSDRF